MIINFLDTCASIIRVNDYDSVNDKLLTSSYSVKSINDFKSWKLTNYKPTTFFTIISADTKKLKDIKLNVVGSGASIKIETSIDYMNWNELEFKGYTDYHSYKVMYSIPENSKRYFNLNTQKYESAADLDNTDTEILKNFNYIFTKYNTFSKTYDYLYENLEFKYIKITLYDIQEGINSNNPLQLSNIEIMIDETFDTNAIDYNLLANKSSIFTQSKYFEDFEFLPDLIKNYMTMIEEKNSSVSNITFTNTTINSNSIAEYSLPEGVGNDMIGVDTVIYP